LVPVARGVAAPVAVGEGGPLAPANPREDGGSAGAVAAGVAASGAFVGPGVGGPSRDGTLSVGGRPGGWLCRELGGTDEVIPVLRRVV
jgi:hypothetical protein